MGVSNTLEVHVFELRRKLEAQGERLIHTLRGRGYVFGAAPGGAPGRRRRLGMSLATRVSAFFLAALGITLLGFSGVLYALADHHLHDQLDDRLEAALGTLEAAVDVEPDGLEWEPTERRLTLGLEPGVEQVHWSVQTKRREDDRPLGQHRAQRRALPPGLAAEHLARRNRRMGPCSRRRPGGGWPRARLLLQDLLQLGRGHPDNDGPEDDVEYPILVITVGISPAPVEASLSRLGLTLASLSAGLWLLAALLGRKLCRHALAPWGSWHPPPAK